ncbi:3-oxoacyl-[acyl-carrier protein] reductase [Microbulbifer donghaiensis]|uniref:3-oxoacyl-[acyl-carrier protein] reductase n=1 Tax=Microbulbifer donghaiensis TaxID=494016 RepID=A0A1M5CE38_9GAMM|nr:SDR family oxidoreductase [Microbulbifer donghaiensis]SHF53034.1 3-oxoacyl-[acyl-carrier protein] reductase [Microbulbifer donghaiensis]
MDLNLLGKRALVCGSSQGIGRACAEQLAALGASVVLFSRDRDKLEAVRETLDTSAGQAHAALVADFAHPEQVKAAVAQLLQGSGPCEILVNNTGGPAPGPAHNADPQAFVDAFNLHLISNQTLVQALLPGMQSAGYGRVINIISTSVKQPLNGLGVSNTVRGAVASWAKTLANELGQFNITVNNVLPGATATVRLDAILENKTKKLGQSRAEVEAAEKAMIPMRRFGEASEIANAVAFLASPAASYINGVNLPVDGGRTGCL